MEHCRIGVKTKIKYVLRRSPRGADRLPQFRRHPQAPWEETAE